MRHRTKLVWMFLPLLVLLAGVGLLIVDLKYPQVRQENCRVLGTGRTIATYKTRHNVVMSDGSADIYDIGFQCPQWGVIVVTDQEILPRSYPPDSIARVVQKQFRLLPDHWRVHISTIAD